MGRKGNCPLLLLAHNPYYVEVSKKKPGNWNQNWKIGKSVPENRSPGTWFLVPRFYWVTGNRVKYIYIFFS
jgi:hypothetical protein